MKRNRLDGSVVEAVETAAEVVAPVLFGTTTKSGIDLGSFEKVELFKKYPKPSPVTSVTDALARLGNDQTKLLSILDQGLQAEAARVARTEDSGWLTYDENGAETSTLYDGTLVSNEILNPTVLNFARLMETAVIRDGKEVLITLDDCHNADEKRACKANA